MSILTDIMNGIKTVEEAFTDVEDWITKLANKDQVIGNTIQTLEKDAKAAIVLADNIGEGAVAYLIPASKAVEAALDAALAVATRGGSAPFNGLINSGIDEIVNAAQQEVHVWGAKVKAWAASAGTGSVAGSVASVMTPAPLPPKPTPPASPTPTGPLTVTGVTPPHTGG